MAVQHFGFCSSVSKSVVSLGCFFSLFSVFMCCSGMMSQRQVAAGLSRGKCFRKEKHSDADSPLKYDDEQLEAH